MEVALKLHLPENCIENDKLSIKDSYINCLTLYPYQFGSSIFLLSLRNWFSTTDHVVVVCAYYLLLFSCKTPFRLVWHNCESTNN